MLVVEQTDEEEQASSNNIDEELDCSQWQMSDALALARHSYKFDQSAHGGSLHVRRVAGLKDRNRDFLAIAF
jgi:hypothetical protein